MYPPLHVCVCMCVSDCLTKYLHFNESLNVIIYNGLTCRVNLIVASNQTLQTKKGVWLSQLQNI